MFNSNKKENGTGKVANETITSVIGEDMHVTGDISSNTSIRIDGKISGNVVSQKLIIVGEKANIKGDLSSKNVILFGRLDGNITASEIQIKKSGVIIGDISVQAIEIEMGGKYNGKLTMMNESGEKNNAMTAKLLQEQG